MNTVAVEDLMSECIVSWCENLAELGCPKDQSPDMWFRYLSEEKRRIVMDKLLDIIERDYDNYKEEKAYDPDCCYCQRDRAILKSHDERSLEVQEANHVVVDPWVCLDCGSKFEPTGNTQCPCCLIGYTMPLPSDDSDDSDDSKTITMKEISIELDDDLIERLLEIARANVVNDKQALINYGANLILKTMIEQKQVNYPSR